MSETAITLYDKIQDPLAAIERLGKVFAASDMFGCTKPEQGQLLALACMASKKDPFQFLEEYHLVNGRRSMRADRMLANFRARGGKVTWVQFDDKAAIGDFVFEGATTRIGYSIDDAQRAGLIRKDSGWTKNPGEMLRARCISRGVRMLCPEAICGAYLPDERPGDLENGTTQQGEGPPKKELFADAKGDTGSSSKSQIVSSPEPAPKDQESSQGTTQVTGTSAVIDVEHAPVSEPATEPQKESPPANADYMDFMKAIKGHEEAAFEWMVKNQKITKDQKLSDVPPGLQRKIVQQREKFLKEKLGVKL